MSRQRVDTVAAVPLFAGLTTKTIGEVASQLTQELYRAGEVVFAQGDPGDRLLIIAEGDGELSARGRGGIVPLATVGPGEVTGELSLLGEAATRAATLTALSDLRVLALAKDAFLRLLREHPDIKDSVERHAEELLTAGFIRTVGPFMSLGNESRRWLAQRLVRLEVPAGEAFIHRGEIGDSCYLIRYGRVDVIVPDVQGHDRSLCSVGPGSVVGETALLTRAPRSATVRAVEACELLELKRGDLEAVARHEVGVGRELVQLFRLRDRPRRDDGVLLSERRTPEGATITILKHPEHLTYYRLSARGRLVWEHLDGYHDLRALTIEFLRAFGEFNPQAVAGVVSGLAETKMIRVRTIRRVLGGGDAEYGHQPRLLTRARAAVQKEVSFRGVDAVVSAAYRRVGRPLFSPVGQIVLAVLAITGLAAFCVVAASAHHALAGSHKEALLLVLPGFVIGTFLHEAGHAFTVKAFGRTVNGAGVGWYWFGPVAFVDTSDMWLGTRRQRILVSLAGPYADLVLAGCASIAALLVTGTTARAFLWSFALPSYVAVLVNLNPLLEYDGYHVLSDLLERPNLRMEALGWLGARFPRVMADRRELRRHLIDLLYGTAAVLYIFVMSVAVVVVYRLAVEGWIASVLPADLSRALAWVLAIGVGLLAALGLWAELRSFRRDWICRRDWI